MNYKVFLDTKAKPFLADFDALPELRPRIKDTIRIGNKPALYIITREEKNSLSSIEPFSFNYFVNLVNSTPDTRTMGRDIAKLIRTLRFLGR